MLSLPPLKVLVNCFLEYSLGIGISKCSLGEYKIQRN